MGKKKGKMKVEGQEVDLGKIKSIKWTLDVEVPKEEFDKLVKAMLASKKEAKNN